MGIPKFFKWLTRRYPLILQNILSQQDTPPTDNLYLDLNSIVHNCIHGNDKTKHERMSRLDDLEEVWAEIMQAIDEIVHTVKPRKMILLAVDGVAPRAKMNQQRERRFRSVKDSTELREQMKAQGKDVPEVFDTNQISPGTKFMHELGKQLEWFVKYKLNTDPLYKACGEIVLSDSSVPGEGEHKMLDYIRNARTKPDYDPNTRHCFYGSDADLIMLSLLTHEPHFYIIREEHVIRKSKHGGVQRIDIERTSNLQLIHISILREYMLLEYRAVADQMKMRFDLERIIDDFVFFCFFIGNDFLPSLSALDISEGSLDHLINFYKKCLPGMTDYITDQGQIHWDRAEPFIELLGKYEHQVFINRVKTLDQKYKDSKNTVTFSDDVTASMGKMTTQQDKTKALQASLKAKIKQKKVEKCKKLYLSHRQKKHKKFLLLKQFEELEPSGSDEDEEETVKLPKVTDANKHLFDKLDKIRKLRREQNVKENKTIDFDKMPIADLVADLDEAYLSDLRPEEIPNEDISDISESELQATEQAVLEKNKSAAEDAKTELVKQSTEQAIENNHNFMRNFVNTYKTDSDEAKRQYYMAKLKFDVKEPKGKRDLHKMLYRYLEGLQWVLFYYYRGAQHWRWYYPYHYAPMISDLGTNIVGDFLNSQTTIKTFRTDTNCNEDPTPYTPFQQLLCILPVKSLRKFLPLPYTDLATGSLLEYFPDDFEIDLNGRALPWEAAILIPFVDEDTFLGAEFELIEAGSLQYTELESKRNTTSFVYPYFNYDKTADVSTLKPLASTLKSMRGLARDWSHREECHDYANVGQASFSSSLPKGVVCPQPDLPSLHWLQAQDLEYREVFVQKVAFKQNLVKIPRCKEDFNGDDFERFIHEFATSKVPELYVEYPRQVEAFPLTFEDPFSIYEVRYDPSGRVNVQKHRQTKAPDEFRHQAKVTCAQLEKNGFYVDHEGANCFVCYNKMERLEYDENLDAIYKCFDDQPQWLPLSMIMRKRDPSHYLNVNDRVNFPHGRIKNGKEAICFNTALFGVMGRVKRVDIRGNTAKVEVDRETEERKLHHPFIAENFLRREFAALNSDATNEKGSKKVPSAEAAEAVREVAQKLSSTRYYGDREIENVLGLTGGCVNRITSSFLVAFDEMGKEERQVVDIGLNLKNFTKKVHVANYVRFIAPGKAASTIYDEFQHNQHSRGSKHIRKHWEYSPECVQIIQDYVTQFPEILDAIKANQKHNKGMNSLFDVYPKLSKGDKTEGITRIREITKWIESLPLSKLPYVEMGFDALDQGIVSRLMKHNEYVAANYDTVSLQVKKEEMMPTSHIFQECHPYWFSPYLNQQTVSDFRVGNRVMNVNSTLRQYIPFGNRGTVVGKTEDHILVVFDEQHMHGTRIYGHCEAYRGGTVFPQHLLNLSRSFAALAGPTGQGGAKNFAAIKHFQEKPLKGQAEYEDQMDSSEIEKRRDQEGPSLREQLIRENHPLGAAAPAKQGGKAKQQFQQKSPNQALPEEKKASEKPAAKSEKKQQDRESKKQTGLDADAPAWQPKQPSAQPQQAVYKPKAAPAKKQEAAGGERPSIWSGKPADKTPVQPMATKGPMFAPLPGLKLADPQLKKLPEFQKIMSTEPEEKKEKE